MERVYIYRTPNEIFNLAVSAVAVSLFDNFNCKSIKEIAKASSVSEKTLHSWKNRLKEEGPKIFSKLTPGRRKKEISSFPVSEKLLIYETINHLLVEEKKAEGKKRRFSPLVKEKLLTERERLKEEFALTYESFSKLLGLDSGSIRLWARKLQKEGRKGLKNKSRAPKRRPSKLAPEVIREIEDYGRGYRRYRRIKIAEFAFTFRIRYRRFLKRFGKTNLSDKVIARYLKEAGLYQEREEKPKGKSPLLSCESKKRGKRGAFRYYFPGAQSLIDTSLVFFLGVRMYLVAVMDGFSRNIFHQEAFLREKAEKIIKCLKTSLKKARSLGLKVFSFLSDHGRPYKSRGVRQYLKEESICRDFSPPYWPQGKAPLERYFRTLKEKLSNKWEVLRLLLKGIFLWIKEHVARGVLNLILLGSAAYLNSRTKNPGIDGKSPAQRLTTGASYALQEATKRVLKEEERNSLLKGELIDFLYQEFGLKVEKRKAKRYLSRYRKESLEQAAEALRRKLVVEDLAPTNRWYYLSKTAQIIEEEKKEEEFREDQETIYKEKLKAKEKEENKRIEEEKLWYENHPEEAWERAVEWYLVFHEYKFSPYQKEIIRLIEKILKRHSILTARTKIDKICQRIAAKESLIRIKDKMKELNLKPPSPSKMQEAKERLITLIKENYSQQKQGIPALQNLRTLWMR